MNPSEQPYLIIDQTNNNAGYPNLSPPQYQQQQPQLQQQQVQHQQPQQQYQQQQPQQQQPYPYQPQMNQPQISQPIMATIGAPVNLNYAVGPSLITCPHCRKDVVTQVHSKAGSGTWIMCLIGCILCGPFGLIPCCLSSCKDHQHNCPSCGVHLGSKEYKICN